MELLFRIADITDIECILKIIHEAQARMGLTGTTQWQDGYPNREIIEDDIARRYGYVALNDGVVVAYAAISGDGEPKYDHIYEGEWLTDGAYLVVHRMAVADEAVRAGVAMAFMKYVEQLVVERDVPSIRVDTNFDNVGMLAIFRQLGYIYCGKVDYEDAGERRAFELKVDN